MIGPEAKWAVGHLIENTIMPQYAYRNCQSFFRFADKYGAERIEQACSLIHAQTDAFSFQLLKNMVEKNMDKSLLSGVNDIISMTPYNENVRGAESYSEIKSDRWNIIHREAVVQCFQRGHTLEVLCDL